MKRKCTVRVNKIDFKAEERLCERIYSGSIKSFGVCTVVNRHAMYTIATTARVILQNVETIHPSE